MSFSFMSLAAFILDLYKNLIIHSVKQFPRSLSSFDIFFHSTSCHFTLFQNQNYQKLDVHIMLYTCICMVTSFSLNQKVSLTESLSFCRQIVGSSPSKIIHSPFMIVFPSCSMLHKFCF